MSREVAETVLALIVATVVSLLLWWWLVLDADAQSLREIVKESEHGHMPTRQEFEARKGNEANPGTDADAKSADSALHSTPAVKGGETSAPGTTAPGPTTTPPGRVTPCLPPGVSLDGLTIIGERHVKAPVDDGSFLQVVSNAWGHGETPVVVLYWLTRQGVPSVLAAVDDDPTGPGKPWVDSTLVRLDGVVITGGHPSCSWKRVGSPAPERL